MDEPSGFKTCVSRPFMGDCVQWPRTWSEQAEIAKYLGTVGIPLHFENGAKEKDDEKHYIPQLYMFTPQYDKVVVRIGDWIVLLGERWFIIVPKAVFNERYTV